MEELLEIIKTQDIANKKLQATNDDLRNELALLREQVQYLTQKLFGKSSEKTQVASGQINLFGDEETSQEENGDFPRRI